MVNLLSFSFYGKVIKVFFILLFWYFLIWINSSKKQSNCTT